MSTLEEICQIGPIYQKCGQRDTQKLAAAVELFRSADAPAVEDIHACVKGIADCADGWMQWSDDKTWSPAWHFSDNGEGNYSVGLFADGAYSQEESFDDPNLACAHFIIKDIEDYGRRLDAARGQS